MLLRMEELVSVCGGGGLHAQNLIWANAPLGCWVGGLSGGAGPSSLPSAPPLT